MTKIVLLWLLSKTIVNVSYYYDIVGHVPRTISVLCGLFLKKGGTISCVVTGPRQPWYSRDLEKLLRDQQRTLLICMCLSSVGDGREVLTSAARLKYFHKASHLLTT